MLNRKEARTLGLAALGAMLEYYDFVIFLFVAAAISEAFFPPGVSPWVSQMQTLGIFAIGYLVRPIAGNVSEHASPSRLGTASGTPIFTRDTRTL